MIKDLYMTEKMCTWQKPKTTSLPSLSLYHSKTLTISCKPFHTCLYAILLSEDTSWLFENGSHVRKLLFFLHRQTNVSLRTVVILQLSNLNLSPVISEVWLSCPLFLYASMSSFDNNLKRLCAKPLFFFFFFVIRHMQNPLAVMS